MKSIKKLTFVGVSVLTMSILVACGNTEKQPEVIDQPGESTQNLAGGTMLAGEEAPEIVGTLKSTENDEVIITVNSKEVTYRLSEEAKSQMDNHEVELGSEVTFTTFSIGDEKESVAEFVVR